MNKGKGKGKLIMALGLAHILSSLSLTLYNYYTENKAAENSANVLSQIKAVEAVTVPDIPDYIINPDMELRKKEIDGNDYVGTLTIPAFDLELPVMAEWSYENFKISPCIYEGTPYKNNMIICAHNYKKHFALIGDLSQGDKVTFTDMDGNLFNYEVIYTEILDNNAVTQMSEGEWDLTLFTCTYGGATRITVRCMLVE